MRPLPVLATVTALAALGGCGDEEPSAEQQVRGVLTTFARAAEQRDYRTICTEVFAPKLLDGLRAVGLPCEVAMRNSLGQVAEPRLTIGRVDVQGARATAEVRTSAAGQRPSSDMVRLNRIEGRWRISDLSEGAAPAPTPTRTAEPSTPGLDEE